MRNILLASFLFLTATAPAPGADSEADRAPRFTATTTAGAEIDFPRHQPGVDIYLFWASWCPFCKALMPHIQSIEEEYGDQVTVYAFQIWDEEDGAAFMANYGYTFEHIPDSDELTSLFGVKGTPGLFVTDPNGLIRLNLYELTGLEIPDADNLKRSQKAARMAPWWAAQIRQSIDSILAEQPESLSEK